MEAPRVQEVFGAGTWEEKKPLLWIFTPAAGEDFYFSVEGWQVDL
jgi:hypothetical protein